MAPATSLRPEDVVHAPLRAHYLVRREWSASVRNPPGFSFGRLAGLVVALVDGLVERCADEPGPALPDGSGLMLISPGYESELGDLIRGSTDPEVLTPTLFFQSVPNPVGAEAGRRHRLTGPLLMSTSADADPAPLRVQLERWVGELCPGLVVVHCAAGVDGAVSGGWACLVTASEEV
jgi:hypothetical protein